MDLIISHAGVLLGSDNGKTSNPVTLFNILGTEHTHLH